MRGNYSIGTVSVENGSKVVTGLGVIWTGVLEPGDKILFGEETNHYLIENVDAFNQLTLTEPYSGDTATDLTYIAGPSVVVLTEPEYILNKTTIIANGSDYASISGLPNPSYVTVTVPEDQGIPEQPVQTVTDGEFRMTTTVPGQYSIRVSTQSYADYEVIIDANPA